VDRAHTSGKGTGLGLSICQRIMQMHGESIRLLDTQSGAAFAFTLPRAGDNALPAAEEKGEA
jgi:signal transduction histidine kinase